MRTDDPLADLPMPDPQLDPAQQPLRMTLLQSQRTAALGIWLILVPAFFLAAITMKYVFHIGVGLVTVFEDAMAEFDHASSTGWMTPIIFVLLPMIAVVLNLLSIAHVDHDRQKAQLHITIKLRWLNLAIILFGTVMLGIFFLHAYAEATHEMPSP